MDTALGFRRARPGFGHFVFDAWLYLITPLSRPSNVTVNGERSPRNLLQRSPVSKTQEARHRVPPASLSRVCSRRWVLFPLA